MESRIVTMSVCTWCKVLSEIHATWDDWVDQAYALCEQCFENIFTWPAVDAMSMISKAINEWYTITYEQYQE